MERIISMLIIVVLTYIIGRVVLELIFKSSIMFTMLHYMLILIMLVSVDMSLVGQYGQIWVALAVSVNFGAGIYIFLQIRKKVAIPLSSSIKQVNELSKGNLKL